MYNGLDYGAFFSNSNNWMAHSRNPSEDFYQGILQKNVNSEVNNRSSTEDFYRGIIQKTSQLPVVDRMVHHPPTNRSQIEEHNRVNTVKTGTEGKPYVCKECGESFAMNCHLKSHERVHMSPKQREALSKPKKRHILNNEKTYKCMICETSFGNSSNLKAHMRMHTGEKPYVCSECGEAFSQSGNMKAHRRSHFPEKQFVCKECGKRFNCLSNLNYHVRRHTNERPFICAICRRGFFSCSHLEYHMRTHTGERPFTCPECNQGFISSCIMKTHMKKHLKEPRHTCPECNKTFNNKRLLHRHKKLHLNGGAFTCDRCNKIFTQERYLDNHRKRGCAEPPREPKGRDCKARKTASLPPPSTRTLRPRRGTLQLENDEDLVEIPDQENQNIPQQQQQYPDNEKLKYEAAEEELQEVQEIHEIQDAPPQQESYQKHLLLQQLRQSQMPVDAQLCNSRNLVMPSRQTHTEQHTSNLEVLAAQPHSAQQTYFYHRHFVDGPTTIAAPQSIEDSILQNSTESSFHTLI